MGVRAFLRRVGVVAAGCAVVVLSACGGDEPAEKAVPKLPPPSPSETASEPVRAGKADAESVEAFVREWARAHTDMYNSGDTARFEELSQGCVPCDGTVERVRRTYSAGGWVRSEAWTLADLTATQYPGNKAKWAVEFTLHDPGVTYQESADSERGSYPAKVTDNQVDVDTRGDKWMVTGFREYAK